LDLVDVFRVVAMDGSQMMAVGLKVGFVMVVTAYSWLGRYRLVRWVGKERAAGREFLPVFLD
jgi:hypothetical protein